MKFILIRKKKSRDEMSSDTALLIFLARISAFSGVPGRPSDKGRLHIRKWQYMYSYSISRTHCADLYSLHPGF
jgi:hypothetical protein